jgi:hypothetical protein
LYLRSAVGVLKNGLIIISPFSLENAGTNGNKNDNRLEHHINRNIAPKNGTNRFLYFPNEANKCIFYKFIKHFQHNLKLSLD